MSRGRRPSFDPVAVVVSVNVDALGAVGHGVDHAHHTEAPGPHGRSRTEHATVGGGCGPGSGRGAAGRASAGRRGVCVVAVGRRINGRREFFDGDGARLSAPLFQSEDHGEVLACGTRQRGIRDHCETNAAANSQ